MACTLSQLPSLMMTTLIGAALCTTSYAQPQDPSAKAPPSAVAVAQPSTQGPTQDEMDKADIDPNQWLTSNKGYLGYRYSKLAQINTQNVSTLKTVCSFKLGEQGSFQSAPLVYNGVLYMTSVLVRSPLTRRVARSAGAYLHTPGAHMGQRNNKGAAISTAASFAAPRTVT